MNDCTYILYKLLRDLPPRDNSAFFDLRDAARLEAARARLKQLPQEYQHDLFKLMDSMNIRTYAQSHYAFALGLDLGLSISRELQYFQMEP